MAIFNGNEFNNVLFGGIFADRISGFAGDDLLAGGDGNDTLFGGTGNDVLSGGSGNDELQGGAGADILVGNGGNDLYFVDNAGDSVVESSNGGGIDSVISTISYRLGDRVENLFLSGNNNLNGFGNNLSNVLSGNNGNNRLSGLSGNDLFLGSTGNDTLEGGNGRDTADYSDLSQAMTLEATGQVNKGNRGIDTLRDVEVIVGAEGQSNIIDTSTVASSSIFINVNLAQESLTVRGIPQVSDQLLTVRNFINVVGTSQNDSITGDARANELNGGAGNDVINGGSGNDFLLGNAGEDNIQGGSGNDVLLGGADNDFITGGNGNDILAGYGFTQGGEIDTLVGGNGIDTFWLGDAVNDAYYVEPLSGRLDFSYALIQDWNPNTDFIQLSNNLVYAIEFRVENGAGSNALDTIIYSTIDGNILGIIQDSTNFNFSRDAVFV